MKKRLLSALLALVMVLALLPASVFAEDTPATPGTVTISVTGLDSATWAPNDTVTFTIGSDTVEAKCTAAAGTDTEGNATPATWSVTGAPTGFGAAFDGTKLTLTTTATGAGDDTKPDTTVFAQDKVSVAVSNAADNSNSLDPKVGSVDVKNGEAEKKDPPEGGDDDKKPNKPEWEDWDTSGTKDASAAQNGMTATYISGDSPKTEKSDAVTGAPGWYIKDTKTKAGYTYIYRITSGYLVGTAYWSNLSLSKWGGSGTITVIGTAGSVDVPDKTSSVTIDVYPNRKGGAVALNITGGEALGTVNIKDSKYLTENHGMAGQKVKVTLSNSWAAKKTSTLTLTDVDVGTISFPGDGYTHTVNLENCSADSISMDGTGTVNGNAVCVKQNLTIGKSDSSSRAGTVGTITITGNGSVVKLKDVTTTGAVTLNGDSTQLEVSGNSDIKSVAINEGSKYSAKNVLTTIKVDGTFAKVGNITFGNTNVTGKANITVTAGTVGDIDMSGASATPAITVTSGQTKKITVNSGTVNVGGTYAHINGLALDGNASFTLTGTNHEVRDISATRNVKISVPADFSNTLKMETASSLDGYMGHGVRGGTWLEHPVPVGALDSSLVYQLNIKNIPDEKGSFTYYNYDQLNQALVSQFKNADKTNPKSGLGDNAILTGVGQKVDTSKKDSYYELQFKNGKTLWGTMLVSDRMQIKLPTMINTVTVNKWADTFHSDRPAGQMYSTPLVANVDGKNTTEVCITGTEKVWELNASGGLTNGDVTKITDISVKSKWPASFTLNDAMGDVKASLSGSVISLSGAVPAGTSSMTLYLTTDAIESKVMTGTAGKDEDVPVTIEVPVIYYSGTKTLQFDTVKNDSLRRGVTLEFNENPLGVLRLSNGTKYTLNGSGLKERADNITVVESKNGATDFFNRNYIEVNVNVSTIKTQPSKDAVIELLNGDGAVYDWSASPAIREAVNAALATITPSQVDGFIKTAQTNAWKKFNQGTPTANDLTKTGYDEAFLVPYLQVNVTAYDPNGTLTATLIPSWRVEVRQTTPVSDGRYATAFADSKTGNPGNVYIARTGGALSLGTNVSEITKLSFDALKSGVTVKFGKGLFSGDVFMHQDSTYAYKQQTNGTVNDSFLIKHNGGSSLGTVTINTTKPLVTLYENDKTTEVAYFDTLQAAVNDAQDRQHIDVDQNYKGSLNVTVTGYARTFTIQANGQNVILANASGGLATLNNTGSEYTVQLSRNAAAVVDGSSATIAVARVANGSATVNATTAKVGATVTVTCTPAVGYRTNNVTASAHIAQNNTNVAVTMTRVSENVYSFKVPEGADSVTVTPAFVVGTAAAIPFTDVATNHWAYNSVKYVYDNGLMNGVNTAGTQFGGNQSLTRAMVVTILYRAAGSPYVGTASNFSDVANNTWYSQAVAWANQNKIVEGYTNGTFQPTWNITRQELATILYRYNTSYKGRATTGSTTLANFPDQGNVSDWATAGMQWAVGNGIVNGITNGVSTTLSPAGSATRYEAATMLMRYGQGMGL